MLFYFKKNDICLNKTTNKVYNTGGKMKNYIFITLLLFIYIPTRYTHDKMNDTK